MGFRRSLVRIQSPRHRKGCRDNELRQPLTLRGILDAGNSAGNATARLFGTDAADVSKPSGLPVALRREALLYASASPLVSRAVPYPSFPRHAVKPRTGPAPGTAGGRRSDAHLRTSGHGGLTEPGSTRAWYSRPADMLTLELSQRRRPATPRFSANPGPRVGDGRRPVHPGRLARHAGLRRSVT